MRVAAALLAATLLALLLLPGLVPDRDPASGRLGASAATVALDLSANRTYVGRNGFLSFTLWLNLTGGGPVARIWTNLTLPGDFLPDPGNGSLPAGCTPAAVLSWQCDGLRSGSYPVLVPARVTDNATVGMDRTVLANGTTFDAGVYELLPTRAAVVRVVGVEFELTAVATPANVRAGERVDFIILARNAPPRCTDVANCTAHGVVLSVSLGPGFYVEPGQPLRATADDLPDQSELGLNLHAIVLGNRTPGEALRVDIRLEYADFDFRALDPIARFVLIHVLPPEVLSPVALLLALGVGILAILGVIAFLVVRGTQALRIDEVFLMHRSGVLLRHLSRRPSLPKDDEIVAAMLVAIQDFVRDSFRSEATLDEFRFAGTRAAIVRGRYTILAALVSRGDVRYLLPQLRSALDAVERAHEGVLAGWDGRMSRLDQVDRVLEKLLQGGYRVTASWLDPAWKVWDRWRRPR